MNYNNLPKIELHLHLDCSLSYRVVQQIRPGISYEEYEASFIAPPKCADLNDYLVRAVRGFELMQTREQLNLVTHDLMRQLKNDHVIYAEIRFAPLLHISEGLTPFEVVTEVNRALEAAILQTGVEARIILCTLRHFTEEQSLETVQLVHQFKGTHVVAFDIAGDEAGFPIDAHKKAFAYARENAIPVTAHAGEARGADSVREVLEHFHPSRIGHGVRSIENETVMDMLKQNDIHLEICPTSNVQTNVVPFINDHPVDLYYKRGVSLSINTDGRTISPVTLSSEYALLEKVFHWNKDHFLKCGLEAVQHAFCGEELKKKLRETMISAYRHK